MRVLAAHPEGPTTPELTHQLTWDSQTLKASLTTLKKHDVIEQNADGRWHITVELLCIWLQKYVPAAGQSN